MADLVTQDGQIQWGDLLLGEGSPYVGVQLVGWDELPDIDSATTLFPSTHGAWPGVLTAGTRVLEFDFEILTDTYDEFPAALDTLRSATAIRQEEKPLIIQLAGTKRLVFGRIIRRLLPADKRYTRGEPTGTLVWECSDPRKYSVEESISAVRLPIPEIGLDWNEPIGLDWNEPIGLDWGQTVSTGNVRAFNAGDADAHPTVEFYGPVYKPSLTNQRTGLMLEYDINLASGDVLEVDTFTGRVLINGTASRLHTATSRSVPENLFVLPPGESSLSFRSGDTQLNEEGLARIRWRSAYW